MKSTVCLILGGGQGSRLFPLTKDRSKPAVPIGGKFRLIDIPVSNSLNSGINKILILTQFNSASLNKHINQTYRFDQFHDGFVDILAAEQTLDNASWYQGTADAVRKTVKHFSAFPDVENVLILSGDQIYKMDFGDMLALHKESKADVTISALPCGQSDAQGFGIMRMEEGRITQFIEKPGLQELTGTQWDSSEFITKTFPQISPEKRYLASMGIYLFKLEVLLEMLDNEDTDFGKHVIPQAIRTRKVQGFLYDGYWEDVGTIKSFHAANMDFAKLQPSFDFYTSKIYTHARFLPPSRLYQSVVDESLICEGSFLEQCHVKKSIIGIRSTIGKNTKIESTVVMGADSFQTLEKRAADVSQGRLPVGIGTDCEIRNAIIDKNARIGDRCRLINQQNQQNADGPFWHIRDGIIIIPKNAEVPSGTII